MAIETSIRKEIYLATGETIDWPIPFPYAETDDLYILLTDIYGKTQEVTENFDVFVNESGDTVIRYPVIGQPLSVGNKLTFYRETPRTQIVDLTFGGPFSPDVLEHDGLDRLEMQIQEIAEGLDRAVQVPIEDERTPEELIDDIFEARDDAIDAADRAEAAADVIYLESGVLNVRRAMITDEDYSAGSILKLPGFYYPKRNVLYLSYAGTVCVPSYTGIDSEYTYDEIGEDPEVLSNEVRVNFNINTGESIDMWVVSSNVGWNIEQIQQLASQSKENADRAKEDADRAEEAISSLNTGTAEKSGLTPLAPEGWSAGDSLVLQEDGSLTYKTVSNLNTGTAEKSGLTPLAPEGWHQGDALVLEYDGSLTFKTIPTANVVVGKIDLLPYRHDELPEGWYFCNGDQYALDSLPGEVLNALSNNFKTDWGITITEDNISLPNMFYTDGRGFFLRSVDGVTYQVGSTANDTMRPITGNFGLNITTRSGAFSAGGSNPSSAAASRVAAPTTNFNSSSLGSNYSGKETAPLCRGMTPAIYLGV